MKEDVEGDMRNGLATALAASTALYGLTVLQISKTDDDESRSDAVAALDEMPAKLLPWLQWLRQGQIDLPQTIRTSLQGFGDSLYVSILAVIQAANKESPWVTSEDQLLRPVTPQSSNWLRKHADPVAWAAVEPLFDDRSRASQETRGH